MNNQLIEDFKSKRGIYEAFCERGESLINELIAGSGITPFKIESRTKAVDSFEEKVKIKAKYKNLNEVTDLVGVRIITYLESDVDKVAEIIYSEFVVDPENSIDKRDLETNEFGYRSLHVVVELNKSREKLLEYQRFKGLKLEIQIRSILQHAWAEIEHDIGYKGKSTLPKSTRRNFNRLAALLETADVEFDRLKKSLDQYEENVTEDIKNKPNEVELNKPSLISYIEGNQKIEELDKQIAQIMKGTFNSMTPYAIESQIYKFNLFGITTIEELDDTFNINFDNIIKFTKHFKEKQKDEDYNPNAIFRSGISLHYLAYALITLPQYIHEADKFANIVQRPNSEASRQLADLLREISAEMYKK